MKDPRELLISIFDYIEEQLKDIDPRGYNLAKIQGVKLVPTEISKLPGFVIDEKLDGDHIWIRVKRLENIPPPALKDVLGKRVIVISADPSGHEPRIDPNKISEVALQDAPEGADSEKVNTLVNDFNQRARSVLAEYLEDWKRWSEVERQRRKTIDLYADLFSLSQRITSDEANKPIELVCGLGVASWKIGERGGIDFQYPLLTQALEISLNASSMDIEIRPRAIDVRVELDALVAADVIGASEVEKAAKEHLARTKGQSVTPFDSSSYTDVLKLIARTLDSKGKYTPAAESDGYPKADEFLSVTEEWLVFTRPKGKNYLIDDLHRLRGDLKGGCDIPGGPLALVTPASTSVVSFESVNFRGVSSRGNGAGDPEELYFPLPYNEEQVTIVQRLQRASGVAVQGPPGTGKTHTIANIICHYLATGRRVLVTSRGEQALKVLQAKIPQSIRPLTVALLTNDREGIRQFQGSIEAIQHQVSQIIPEKIQSEIKILKSSADRTHAELQRIDRRIDEIAETQLSEISVDGALMRAQRMAELVVNGKSKYSWFDDSLSLDPKCAPPMSDEEITVLRAARRRLSERLSYVGVDIPKVTALPPVDEVVKLHSVLTALNDLDGDLKAGRLLPLAASTDEVLQLAEKLIIEIESLVRTLKPIEESDGSWALKFRDRIKSGTQEPELAALTALFPEIDEISADRASFLKKPISIPDAAVISPRYKEAVERASRTGKPFGVLQFGNKETKIFIYETQVSGLPVSSPDDWGHVRRYLDLSTKLTSFCARWNQLADQLSLPALDSELKNLRQIEKISSLARQCYAMCTSSELVVGNLAGNVFAELKINDFLGSTEKLESLRHQLKSHLTRSGLIKASVEVSRIREKLVGCGGEITDKLNSFFDATLGNAKFSNSDVATTYSVCLEELRQLSLLAQPISDIENAVRAFASAGAERFASRIGSIPVADDGQDSILRSDWREAWLWARLKTHLETIEARNELVEITERRGVLETGLANTYKEIVAKEAWLWTKRNATPAVLQALAGYAVAIRRIGQGTGPNASRYRRNAVDAMNQAADSVPCWIMSHAKISESMPAKIGAFDLVIVDEASQSDLWAIPAIVRGKKVLVVGDDKQVSPDGGFIASTKIQNLITRFLTNQPFKEEMTPEKSLYDLASRVFAAQQVMLREHFRCVPSIIAYSNRHFYENGIQPLRIPTSSERIDPPLVDVFVEGGYRDKHDRNRLEAEAIAQEISNIVSDQRFAGRTIGVVSLLGFDQAKLIDSLVREKCEAGELIRREFECGDARTFQGSERDVIFLSLVVDSSNCKALSGNMFDQRFNVAASRARDRMYLYRSVKLADVSTKDIRASLLSHFDKPVVVDEQHQSDLSELCESQFERDVFTLLTSKGYKVTPQVKSGTYRIDMVVEGLNDTRLAIELDGDGFHGPDRWQQDIARQRVLERAGWIFWRCFASTWSMRREEVAAELFEKLRAMGIEPIGKLEALPSIVEKRVWTIPAEVPAGNQ